MKLTDVLMSHNEEEVLSFLNKTAIFKKYNFKCLDEIQTSKLEKAVWLLYEKTGMKISYIFFNKHPLSQANPSYSISIVDADSQWKISITGLTINETLAKAILYMYAFFKKQQK